MGYYVAIPCCTRSARDKMRAFLHANFREASRVMPWIPVDYGEIGPPRAGKEVCSYAKAMQLGWYRNAGWSLEAKAYAASLLRWACLKVGRTASFDGVSDTQPLDLHYTIYETEQIPFVVRSEHPDVPDGWDAEGYDTCDELGWDASFRPLPNGVFEVGEGYVGRLRLRQHQADPLIRAELVRLNALWER